MENASRPPLPPFSLDAIATGAIINAIIHVTGNS
jgi:hypothetical protein